jgi:hypothetical protein
MSDRPQPGETEPADASDAERVDSGDAERVDTSDAERVDTSDAEDAADARAMRALLKRSLARDVENAPDLLAGVQRRIRTRSRGKFFADGWSTTQARASYALIGMLTLLLVVLAYLVLGPIDVR